MKYLRGNIFDNTNSFAISDALSRVFGGFVYSSYGLKKSFLTSFGIAIIGSIGIYLIQSNNPIVTNFPYFKSYLTAVNAMPILTMLTKFGIGAAMLTTYSASFGDEHIFPSKKRATAIGICNIIARSVTVFAPMVNEFPVPIPMLFFIASTSFALIISFSFY